MAKKSKLLTALDAHKGRDYEAEKQKKMRRRAAKRKAEMVGESEAIVESGEEQARKSNGVLELSEESEGYESDESNEFGGMVGFALLRV